MYPRRKSEMELIHLILPIVGAFLLLFIVCCCGKKVKQVLHIPKEVVMGHYVLTPRPPQQNQASRTTSANRRQAQADTLGDIEANSCLTNGDDALESEITTSPDFTSVSQTSDIHLREWSGAGHIQGSERDSGVYSLVDNFSGNISGTAVQGGRRQHHSSSSTTTTASEGFRGQRTRHCSSRSEASVVVNIRRTSSNNDEEFVEEGAGVCIIHQSSFDDRDSLADEQPITDIVTTGQVKDHGRTTDLLRNPPVRGDESKVCVPSLSEIASIKVEKVKNDANNSIFQSGDASNRSVDIQMKGTEDGIPLSSRDSASHARYHLHSSDNDIILEQVCSKESQRSPCLTSVSPAPPCQASASTCQSPESLETPCQTSWSPCQTSESPCQTSESPCQTSESPCQTSESSCRTSTTPSKKAGCQNRVTFSDKKLTSHESQESAESVFLS